MRFESRIDLSFKVILWTTIVICVVCLLLPFVSSFKKFGAAEMIGIAITYVSCIPTIILLLSIYYNTCYELFEDALVYRSGPFQGRIAIDHIREIIVNCTSYSGIRPALARNGLLIKFKKYDEIYISPDNNENFLEAIQVLNPNIKIKMS